MLLEQLGREAYGILRAQALRRGGVQVPMPGFSLPIFAEISGMWRDYQNGLWPAPGGRENQNALLLDAFDVLSAAEARALAEPVKAPETPRGRGVRR